jgi:hypothetical protein
MKKTPTTFHALKPLLDFFQTGVPVLMYHKIAEPPTAAGGSVANGARALESK